MPAFDRLATLIRRHRFVVPLFLAIILLAPFARVILHPASLILGERTCDSPTQFYFFHEFAAECWRNGAVPLWNPCIMLGLPFLGEGQASVFHPLSAPFLFLPTAVALNFVNLACFVLGGLAFCAYLRAVDLGRAASLFGAITWCFSSVAIGRIYAGHINILFELPVLPFILWCWHRYLRDHRRRHLAILSLGYGSLFLAGYPQMVCLFSIFLLLNVLLHGVGGNGAAAWSKEIGALGLFVAIGVAIGAVQLLPSLEFARNSFRSKSSYEFCTFFSMAPENFLTLLCPEFFGRSPTAGEGAHWGRGYFWETWLYIGILPLLAAVTGLCTAPERLRRVLGVTGVFFLILGLGKFTPLYRFFYNFVPLYDVFRCPVKHNLLVAFCAVVFAAHGFQYWLDTLGRANPDSRTPPRAFRCTLFFGILLLGVCVVWSLIASKGFYAGESVWQRFMTWVYERREVHHAPFDASFSTRAAHFAFAQFVRAGILLILSLAAVVVIHRRPFRREIIAVLILGLLLADFATFIPHFTDCYDESRTRYSDAFLKALPQTPYPARIFDHEYRPNMAMRYHLSSIGGYTGAALRRYNRFLNETQGFDPTYSQASASFKGIPDLYFDLLAIDAMHIPRGNAQPTMKATPTDDGWVMVDCRGRCPRAFLAASPHVCATPDEALAYILSDGSHVQEHPAVEMIDPPPSAPLGPNDRVEITSFGPNRVELSATSTRPRVLVLCEMFDEGWTAQVNGHPAAIHPANFLFRSIMIPGGKSTVVFEYRPRSFTVGAITSLVALMVLGVLLVYPRTRPDE